MEQRRLRLGDILDDYCPRERRITNHAIVAMIDNEVKQTRCTTCDADHEYKQAKIPPQRRKKLTAVLGDSDPADATLRPAPPVDDAAAADEAPEFDPGSAESFEGAAQPAEPAPESVAAVGDDDGPVHRRLIRATLPRPDGQMPERKNHEFTIRQPGIRGGDGRKNGHRRGRRPMPGQGGSQSPRFGGHRPGGSGQGQGPRQGAGGPGQGPRPMGNRPGHPGGVRGRRPGPGTGRGGHKRGR